MTTIVRVIPNPVPGLRAEATIEHIGRGGAVTATEVRVLKKGEFAEFAVYGGQENGVRVTIAEVSETAPAEGEEGSA